MRAAGVALWRDHTGWASMGPVAAIPRIPKLLLAMLQTAAHIVASKPDLVVLVDFGVFNLRLARQLRRMSYGGPILDLFPPGTWFDDEEKARRVSSACIPVTAFKHQYDFYRGLGCRIEFFGHPLTGRYALRPRRNLRRATEERWRFFPAAAAESYAVTCRYWRRRLRGCRLAGRNWRG